MERSCLSGAWSNQSCQNVLPYVTQLSYRMSIEQSPSLLWTSSLSGPMRRSEEHPLLLHTYIHTYIHRRRGGQAILDRNCSRRSKFSIVSSSSHFFHRRANTPSYSYNAPTNKHAFDDGYAAWFDPNHHKACCRGPATRTTGFTNKSNQAPSLPLDELLQRRYLSSFPVSLSVWNTGTLAELG